MKRNILLLSLVLAGAVSANCFAYEIYKGKVTQHKEWTTGNAKGSFIANTSNKMMPKKSMGSGRSYIQSSVEPSKTFAGSAAKISGSNYISITNSSDKDMSYHYTVSVCGMTADNAENCLFFFDEIDLSPGGYFNADLHPELQVNFDKAGSYKTYVQTYLGSGDPNEIQLNSVSYSTAEVS